MNRCDPRGPALALLACTALVSSAGAQELSEVRLDRPGTLVRVAAPLLEAGVVEGSVEGWAGDRLVVRTGGGREVEVSRGAIERIDFSTGRHGHPWWGVAIGSVVTGIPAAVWWNRECEGSCRAPALEGFVLGALYYGVLPGFIVGSLVKTRNWRRLPLVYLDGAVGAGGSAVEIHLAPAPYGGVSAGLRIPLWGRSPSPAPRR